MKMNAAMPNNISPPENGTIKTGLKSSPPQTKMSWSSLILGLGIMIILSIYPTIFADKAGKVNHSALMILMWAMMAGIVRGVGFVPQNKILKVIFSKYAAYLTLVIAIGLNFLR